MYKCVNALWILSLSKVLPEIASIDMDWTLLSSSTVVEASTQEGDGSRAHTGVSKMHSTAIQSWTEEISVCVIESKEWKSRQEVTQLSVRERERESEREMEEEKCESKMKRGGKGGGQGWREDWKSERMRKGVWQIEEREMWLIREWGGGHAWRPTASGRLCRSKTRPLKRQARAWFIC